MFFFYSYIACLDTRDCRSGICADIQPLYVENSSPGWSSITKKTNKYVLSFIAQSQKIMTLHLKNKKFDMKIICAYCIFIPSISPQRMLFWSDPDTWCLWHHPTERSLRKRGSQLNVPVCHRISPAGPSQFFHCSLSSCSPVYGRYALWEREGRHCYDSYCLPVSSQLKTLTKL